MCVCVDYLHAYIRMYVGMYVSMYENMYELMYEGGSNKNLKYFYLVMY